MNSNQWDTYSKLYNDGIGTEGDKLHKNFIDPLIFQFMSDYRNKVVADVGCGNGYFARKIAIRAKKVFGLDYSAELVKLTKTNTSELTNIEILFGDVLKRWPIRSNSCDIVISNMLLQYLSSLTNFAKEAARILKKKGILIITIDSPLHSLFVRAQELLGKKDKKLIQSGSYFKREKRLKKTLWDKATIEYYNRPLMDYFNAFTDYFIFEHMDENTEDGEMPRILGLKWCKIKN